MPSLDLREEIFDGEALVTSNNGEAFMRIFNTNEEDVYLIIPTVELQELDTADTCVLSTVGPKSADESSRILSNSPNRDNKKLKSSYLPLEITSTNVTTEPDTRALSPLG